MIQVLFIHPRGVKIYVWFQLKPIDVRYVQKRHPLLIKPEPALCKPTEGFVALPFELSDLLPVAALFFLL